MKEYGLLRHHCLKYFMNIYMLFHDDAMKLSITTKVFLAFITVLAMFALVSIYSIMTIRSIGHRLEVVDEGYIPLTKIATEIETLQSKTALDVENIDKIKDRRILSIFRRLYPPTVTARLSKMIARAGTVVAHNLKQQRKKGERRFFVAVQVRLAQIRRNHDDNIMLIGRLLGAAASEKTGEMSSYRRRLSESTSRLKTKILALADELEKRITDSVLDVRHEERKSAWTLIFIVILAVLLGILITVYIQLTVRPIRRLTDGVKRISMGDYSQRVELSAKDEIGVLAREFNSMAASLEQLIQSERLATIGKMAAQITHEIRNPLSSIGLNVEMLEDELAHMSINEESVKLLRSIQREVDRLTDITEQYLQFARLPKPKMIAEDINEILGDLIAFMKGEFKERNIEMSTNLADELPLVAADENQLRQAFMNLLRNSYQSIGDSGSIVVTTQLGKGNLEIEIKDSGEGIPADQLQRIFDPFFSTKKRGTGIGLSLTHQIILEHGGHISCHSEVGKGTVFTVALPFSPNDT